MVRRNGFCRGKDINYPNIPKPANEWFHGIYILFRENLSDVEVFELLKRFRTKNSCFHSPGQDIPNGFEHDDSMLKISSFAPKLLK